MADEDWGEYEKKDWVEEVGEKKMAAVLIVQVEQVGLCLFPRKSKFGWLFRVVRGVGVSPFNSPGNFTTFCSTVFQFPVFSVRTQK